MKELYLIAGISKQGFHQWLNRRLVVEQEGRYLIEIVRQLREDHPTMSCRTMYFMIQPRTMGRDHFEAFCFDCGYKVEQRRLRFKTTDSRGVLHFPNLILSLNELTGINQLWVSDITYYMIGTQMYYLTFVTDIFNREIVGFSASETLRTEHTTLPALNMAIRNREIPTDSGLIFHSDGGGQYYCKEFISLTRQYGINNSMGKTAYENPHAERINGIIKNSYLIPYQPENFQDLKRMLIKVVHLYNAVRPHQSLNRLSPQQFLSKIKSGLLTKTWVINKKKKVTKKEKVNISIT